MPPLLLAAACLGVTWPGSVPPPRRTAAEIAPYPPMVLSPPPIPTRPAGRCSSWGSEGSGLSTAVVYAQHWHSWNTFTGENIVNYTNMKEM
eukprot:COSAG04_NODE_13102_length_620_cov_0.886756_1_plen_90_part_10